MSAPKVDRELLLLKIRNAIANKEWATASANMQTALGGRWTCDWYADVRENDLLLRELMAQLEQAQRGEPGT